MSQRPLRIKTTLGLAAGLMLAGSPSQAAEACARDVRLDLTDRDYVELRLSEVADYRLGRDLVDHCFEQFVDPSNRRCDVHYMAAELGRWFSSSPVCVTLDGSGMIEVGFAIAGLPEEDFPPLLNLNVTRAVPGSTVTGEYRHGKSFREVVSSSAAEYSWQIKIGLDGDLLRQILARYHESDKRNEAYAFIDLIESVELVAAARKVEDYCTMSATVSGDVNQHFFGDLAYFNAVEHPVKKGMMVGTIGETQTHEDVEGFGTFELAESPEDALALAAQLGLIDEEEAEQAAEDLEDEENNQEEEQHESGGFAEWAEQELRAENPEEGDNFGLNLADIKADVTPKTDEGAGAMFAGAFTMAISGRVGQAKDQQRIVIVPSLVMATVGLGDKGGDRISFELQEGNPPSIDGTKVTDDFIIGRLEGELETKGVYTLEGEGAYTSEGVAYTAEGAAISPRKLEIHVVAHFAARRGSLSCMR